MRRTPKTPPSPHGPTKPAIDHASSSTASLRGTLWDRAYESLKKDKPNLVDAFEQVLRLEPSLQSVPDIFSYGVSNRQQQLASLVDKKLKLMNDKQ